MVEQLEASLDSDVDEISVEALDQQYWISKAWLKGVHFVVAFIRKRCTNCSIVPDWKLLKPKMHRLGLQDPSPDDKPYRDHVYCDHDGLVHSTHSRVSILAEVSLAFCRGCHHLITSSRVPVFFNPYFPTGSP
jgi:hypothetical protein